MLDEIDKKLLNLLQDDASLTHKQLAAELNLTVTPVFERIKKLRKKGVIKGIHASIDRRAVNKPLMAFCEVSVANHKKEYLDQFEKKILELDEVVECHHVSGRNDYMLKIVENNMDDYRDFLVNKLAKIEGVSNVNSSFVMKELKEGNKITL
ncbi:Lrp/AsnC family transcriptional regulator [Paracrocinitomix mangrovi]|uniref:Lrp/AsnC family transcriptional regulator n=1 Tax=Paracrocinitomix mangrovi TaxID=2862509 RepID=UPI001C8EC6B8|nr:Lrp/AsnC family transcriptional regulator [Paracrocinitomix mangrovi]UKN00568.1 Lrp/AsnC family transcriptional regulator [Paracrocinitomix mangrovi]